MGSHIRRRILRGASETASPFAADDDGRLIQNYTEEDLDLIEEFYALESRESFWAFRQYINPNLRKGWFIKDLACKLQEFYEAYERGERPVMLIMAPPQHGKSFSLHDFIAWVMGKNPNIRAIYGSYSEDLGERANLAIQRTVDDRSKYGRVFPDTRFAFQRGENIGNYLRNLSMLEIVGQKGSFQNTTVQGQITGKGLEFGVIDDPLKGRAEASSRKTRDKTWNWFMDDFYSRFSEYAALILTMTRWHVDDPGGRLEEMFPNVIKVKYKAIASSDEPYRKKGEALFPEFKSLEFLNKRRMTYTNASWQSLYQQSPIIAGGGTFPIEKFKYQRELPRQDEITKLVRYWDKAGTEDGGAYTAGVLMAAMQDNRYIVIDVVHGQWGAWERARWMKATAVADDARWGNVEVWTEQEPGSGGLESAQRTIASLAGHDVHADRVTGKKEVRAEPYAAQVQAGNVVLCHGNWNTDFVDEHELFPNGTYKDQVDAAAGAFMKVMSGGYDKDMNWV